ncbi:sigma-70 family RNA polymerase sigma factor [Evansella sp. AB-P1]|uniref:sigma-70 family RNA polymerase sigma factor n=1 Tax=Evansella sp. AB-P1 TaxID=3037653 RepID=UPI00241FA45A|nr:sigma-70 family RNA polymerase sigma factor [Evansella sp. AB-P1]MDG5786965.1 sigma-70 family RNA polymerase sigma factor [Evansella sp. AB-P1]
MQLKNRKICEKEKVLQIESLLGQYGTELKRLSFLYVKDHTLAEDVLQEVFIACYQNLASFREESSYKTWLIRITINKCKDILKKWSFRHIFTRPIMEGELTSNNTPENQSVQKMEKDILAKSILQLPLKFREVIILFYYEELSVEEISSILQINKNTVKSRLKRSREKLKMLLQGWEEEWRS